MPDKIEFVDIMPEDTSTLEAIIARGPNRMMTPEDVAVLPRRRPHLKWQWIFVRDDGWSLGANEQSVWFAHRTWPKQWRWVIIRELVDGVYTVVTIDYWRELFAEGEL